MSPPLQPQIPLLYLTSLCSLSFSLTIKWCHEVSCQPWNHRNQWLINAFCWWPNLMVHGYSVCHREVIIKPDHTLRTIGHLPGGICKIHFLLCLNKQEKCEDHWELSTDLAGLVGIVWGRYSNGGMDFLGLCSQNTVLSILVYKISLTQ